MFVERLNYFWALERLFYRLAICSCRLFCFSRFVSWTVFVLVELCFQRNNERDIGYSVFECDWVVAGTFSSCFSQLLRQQFRFWNLDGLFCFVGLGATCLHSTLEPGIGNYCPFDSVGSCRVDWCGFHFEPDQFQQLACHVPEQHGVRRATASLGSVNHSDGSLEFYIVVFGVQFHAQLFAVRSCNQLCHDSKWRVKSQLSFVQFERKLHSLCRCPASNGFCSSGGVELRDNQRLGLHGVSECYIVGRLAVQSESFRELDNRPSKSYPKLQRIVREKK